MPKLKNSASLAIWSATTQARGSSIIVPTRYFTFDALLGEHLLGRVADDLRLGLQLGQEADQRDHDLRLDLDAFLLHVAGRLEDGPRLHLA